MKVSDQQLINACKNFANNKESHEERITIIGYIMYLESILSHIGGDIIIGDDIFDSIDENSTPN